MEKKNTIWVVVTWDNESARLTGFSKVDTIESAERDVVDWYNDANEDENCEYAQLDDDNLFATALINGREENTQAFEIEL